MATELSPTPRLELMPPSLAPDRDGFEAILAEFGIGTLPECPFCSGELPHPIPDTCPHCESPLEAHRALKQFAAQLLREAGQELAVGELDNARVRVDLAREVDRTAGLPGLYLEAQAAEFAKEYAHAVLLYAEFGRLLDPATPIYHEVNGRLRALEETLRAEEGAKGFYNLALLRAKQGYLEEAVALAQRAVALAPHLAKPYLLLHKLKLKLRDYPQAQYYLERYYAYEPSDPQVVALARHLVQDQADERLRRLVLQFYWGLAWAFGLLFFVMVLILLKSPPQTP
ncbi:MAG TPA: hypothetical protein VEI97_02145 [bacterium]|nr:hypothetical protein [bacterium]